jgi:polysaccharide export outer membrane protein
MTFTAGSCFAQSSYNLGSGDLISIVVFDEEELTMEVRVAKTPMSYPFLGQVPLDGRNLAEVEQQIKEGLKGDYLIEPSISISVIEYRPFFITGEVEKPGGYPFQPGLTLRKAISLGGGFTERASRTKMFITRGGEGSEQKIQLSDPIFPDDVLTIEQSFF